MTNLIMSYIQNLAWYLGWGIIGIGAILAIAEIYWRIRCKESFNKILFVNGDTVWLAAFFVVTWYVSLPFVAGWVIYVLIKKEFSIE